MLNAWLADQKPADNALCNTAWEGLVGMSRWVEEIAAGRADTWSSAPFRASADALRVNGQFLSLQLDDSLVDQASSTVTNQYATPELGDVASLGEHGAVSFDKEPALHSSHFAPQASVDSPAAVVVAAIEPTLEQSTAPLASQPADFDFDFDLQLPEAQAYASTPVNVELSALPQELHSLDLSLSSEPVYPLDAPSALQPTSAQVGVAEPDFDVGFAFDLGEPSTMTADDDLSVVSLGLSEAMADPDGALAQAQTPFGVPAHDISDEFLDVFAEVPVLASAELGALAADDGLSFDLGEEANASNDELVSADEFAAFERAMREQDAVVAPSDVEASSSPFHPDAVAMPLEYTSGTNDSAPDTVGEAIGFPSHANQAVDFTQKSEPDPVVDLGGDLDNLGGRDLVASSFSAANANANVNDGAGALVAEIAADARQTFVLRAPSLGLPSGSASLTSDEQYKAIGPLRINLPLYNVYLNEADEWSRRLLTCLTEWSLELNQPLPNDAVVFAHSLAGSSSTVGFTALSGLARTMENALQHVQNSSDDGGYSAHSYAADFVGGAEEIRRLLHQFAAGLLREPLAGVQDALERCLRAPEQATQYQSIGPASDSSGFVNLDDDIFANPQFVQPVSQDATPSGLARLSAVPVHSGFTSLSDTSSVTVIAAAAVTSAAAAMASTVTVRGDQNTVTEVNNVPVAEPEIALGAGLIAKPVAMEATEDQGVELLAVKPETVEPERAALSPVESIEALVAIDVVQQGQAAKPYAEPKPDFPVLGVATAGLASMAALNVISRNLTEQETEDEIDLVDVLDPDLFPIFEEEALELFPQMGGALRQWTSRPDNSGARSEVLRGLHTLKGSARLAGALRLGELAHRMESAIEQTPEDEATTAKLEPLTGLLDGLQANFDRLRRPQEGVTELAPTLEATAARAPTSSGGGSNSAPTLAPPALSAMAPLHAASRTATVAPMRGTSNQTVRVRSQLLDRLVNQAGEVMISRSRLEAELGQLRGSMGDLTANLDKLRSQLRDIEVQSESQMQSRMALSKENNADFDPLEFDRFTRVQELTRMMAESVNDVATVQRSIQRTVEATEDDLMAQARQTRELQRDLLRTRMVEFEGISERLYRVVRQAGKDAGKQVKLDIIGGSIEMDRGVLDRMTPAFEHLLRNCVAHGIEAAETRIAAGKDANGQITISLHQEGNDISVEFRDDGAGLDLKRIRERASAQGLLSNGQQFDDNEAANLIFTPGFTTATQVTELSGRGIGMDVVRSEVVALGGRIETSTSTGLGTNFKLVLPLTTAVTQVVMLRIGNLSIGVPANLVETVRRASPKELQAGYNTGTFDVAGEALPFFWSGALLQHSRSSEAVQGKTIPVLVFRSAAQRIVAHVDEVLGNQEVVVKNLGPQLSRLPGLAGMSVLASGAVALIYNPVALATVYGDQARAMSFDKAEPHALAHAVTDVEHRDLSGDASPVVPLVPANPSSVSVPQIPLILVVDDSITVRRVTQRLLQREGYRVALAADGLQALERLAEELPGVVLSDIEMPRMDGFDLVRNIKADPRLASLPIITITSRIAEKHREHAKSLGVDHYLGKPYSEEELLSLIRRYTAIDTPV